MISYSILLYIIVIHFIADFMCQTHMMAINKSKSNYWLTQHIIVYTLLTYVGWSYPLLYLANGFNIELHVCFLAFIFGTHWVTDYITSRISSKYFTKGDYHNGFVVVGFDQILHYIQLLTAYYLFANKI